MSGILEILELVSGKLSDVAHSDVVVGDPIKLGEVTIVVLSRVSVGMVGGNGKGEGGPQGKGKGAGKAASRGKGEGGGMGGGGKVRPVAIVAFTPRGVKIHPIPTRRGVFDKLLDKVPNVVEMAKRVMGKDGEGKDSQE